MSIAQRSSPAVAAPASAGTPHHRAVDLVAWLCSAGVIAATVFVVLVFPDASSASAVRRFYDEWSGVALIGITILTAFFFVQVWSLGWMTAIIRRAEGEGPYAWITFGAELMFMTVFNVEIGLWATAHLLQDRISDESLYVLHVAGFVIAAPVTFAGVAYFAAIVGLQRTTGLFPRHVVVIAAVAGIGNLGALGGLVATSGPFNPASGAIAIGGPMIAWMLWYGAAFGWFYRHRSA
ncbi:hypothetical protein [Tsukamurella ocularis]|uniref:hypothetical protein n=1 Tax=Tsukamurella ocularis TaxID=1970234 RepID=UPI0021677D8D|nr:hypothetical protein [Tsukamurella ocularis]MCS3778612.1 hypothetical protein [Tsukamurella ocularis]MCS3789313.1 hypothetical protein [Tsukamurella ocularis]MCS3851295.1 hypothetical protein [Tsukamurella ocularis]